MKEQPQAGTRQKRQARQGVCPLCERAFLRAQLEAPVQAEPPGTRRTIVAAIREKFPSWTTQAGACRECWESFAGVARVANFMKKFKLPRA